MAIGSIAKTDMAIPATVVTDAVFLPQETNFQAAINVTNTAKFRITLNRPKTIAIPTLKVNGPPRPRFSPALASEIELAKNL